MPTLRKITRHSRGWEIPRNTSDPERARHNLLKRDRMFTDRLSEETKRLALPTIEINTAMHEDELARQVTRTFRLGQFSHQPSGRSSSS